MHDENAIKNTKPYPDVIDTLKKLNSKKVLMAIATNKRHVPTIKLINHYNLEDYFITIECSDDKNFIRNKAEMIQDILNKDKNFYKAFFIGDTVNDCLSANLSELNFIKADYGYGRGQDWSKVNVKQGIQNFSEILQFI